MSASPAQIEANRANAKLSTGPTSEAGKRASSQNATNTGLTSARFFVRPEEQTDFDQFKANLLGELQPGGQLQFHSFEAILHAAWNIRRCLALECEIQNEAIAKGLPDALLDDELSRKLDRVYRYKRMHESAKRHAMADLRQLQNEQIWRKCSQMLEDQPVLADTAKILVALNRSNAIEAKQRLDNLRSELESFMAPPIRRQ